MGVPAAGRSSAPTAGTQSCLRILIARVLSLCALKRGPEPTEACRSGLVGSFASGGIGVGAIVDGGSMHPRWDPARGTLALRQIANIPVSNPRARPQGPADHDNASLRLRQTCRREEYACTWGDVESTFVTPPLLAWEQRLHILVVVVVSPCNRFRGTA